MFNKNLKSGVVVTPHKVTIMRQLLYAFLVVIALSTLSLRADEGMWTLPQFKEFNYATMQQMGLELSAEEIYSANGGSIKDAVVIFDTGCTGEVVSPQGLLFTNHHCGYRHIQALSSVDSDYLRDGFWALNQEGELPVPGLSVTFTRSIIDVTAEVLGGVPSIAGQQERERMVAEVIERMASEFESNTLFIPRISAVVSGGDAAGQASSLAKQIDGLRGVESVIVLNQEGSQVVDIALNPSLSTQRANKLYNSIEKLASRSSLKGVEVTLSPLQNNFKSRGNVVSIKPFYGGNRYYMFIMENYSDVRLVGTPPQSIGKFGGETDNWMWPRHTGDFAIFRVYAGSDNRPASYSSNNQPYHSEEYLKISTAGYDEGDLTMILGFPGSTQRLMSSYELDELINISNPQRIAVRGARQEILKERMNSSDRVRLQYASKYATSANYWKYSIGVLEAIEKLGVRDRKLAEQEEFMAWAAQNTLPTEGYIDALSLIESGRAASAPLRASLQYISEAMLTGMNIISIARGVSRGFKDDITDSEREELVEKLEELYRDYDLETEHAVSERMMRMVSESVEHKPSIFTKVIDSLYDGDISKYLDHLYSDSHFSTLERAKEFARNFTSQEQVEADPAVELAASVYNRLMRLRRDITPHELKVREGQRLYVAGVMLQNPDKHFAPDANFTMRLTYGQVLPYSPEEGVEYEWQTTLDGVVEKEDSTSLEFIVDERLKQIYRDGDYGAYADKQRGVMPVNFISNNDITGGNSGSPVLNSKGELIGIAFDGNWDAISADIAFESELQRSISVDVRYLLLILDSFAGASWLLDEMDIVGD